MKLKDKIECTLERHVKLKENQSENIEKIVEYFAIGFAEWACKNNYFLYRIPSKEQEELLQRYKKEKQL